MRNSVRAFIVCAAIVAEFFLGCGTNFTLWAQSGGATTGELIGYITDVQGVAVTGAVVTSRRLGTNLTHQTQTDASGHYTFLQLPPGNYEITVEATEFTKQTASVTVMIGTTQSASFTLKIEQTQDVIEVSAVDTSFQKNRVRRKTESSTIINQLLVDSLPINQRDFLDFSKTAARVTEDRIPAQGVSTTSKLSFNGQPSRLNNINVDGLDNNDRGVGSVLGTLSQEAVQEFQIVSDSFSAEFGRSLGGIINIVTRNGSNDWHGTLFGFFRNDTLSARDAFSNLKPPFEQDQFGVVSGGPIKRDKFFYFTSFERRSIQQNNIVTIGNETIAAARHQGFQLRNGPIPFSFGSTSVLGRLDANLTPNLTLWLRYNRTTTYDGNFEPFGGLIAETSTGLLRATDHVGAGNVTYSNPRLSLVNETRFLISRYVQKAEPAERGVQVNLVTSEGLVAFGQGILEPGGRDVRPVQIINHTTMVKGRHHLKFGGDYLRAPGNGLLGFFAGGLANFSPLSFSGPGGSSIIFTGLQAFDPTLRTPQQQIFLRFLASVLPQQFPTFPAQVQLDRLGLPLNYIQGFGKAMVNPLVSDASGFVQDEVTLRTNLLLKVGIRYDHDSITGQPANRASFSPRLAISYNPGWLPRVNLRIAYGHFYGSPLAGVSGHSEAYNSGQLKGVAVPFPFSVLAFALPGHGYPASSEVPPDIPIIPQLGFETRVDPHLKPSYTQQTVVEVNWAFHPNWQFSTTYNLTQGRRILAPRNINPVVRPIPGDPLLSLLTGRVDPTRGVVLEFESAFASVYHGLTVGLEHRSTTHGSFSAHYTFSKAIDNFLDPLRFDLSNFEDPLRPALDRGLSVQDVRHRFVFTGAWNPNFSKHPLLRNYQVSTIIRMESGRPYNLLAGVDLNLNGDTPPSDRPQINGVPLGRNVGITPGFASVDVRLTRTLKFGEHLSLQLIGEVFNLFNRTNINQVDNIFPPDQAGNFQLPPKQGSRYGAPPERWRSAFAPRQFQLGFRFTF